jgi:hypothetical protein
MANVQEPSEDEHKAFVAKLTAFRDGLTSTEQRMFDELVRAAVARPEPAEVTPFWLGGLLGGSGLGAPGTTTDIWTSPEGSNNPFR